LGRILQALPLELDMYNRPCTVRPCLSDASHRKCGTAAKVGYSCYGCIGAKFPASNPLFRNVEHLEKDKPFDPNGGQTPLHDGRRVLEDAA
jgi:hypothetical protein